MKILVTGAAGFIGAAVCSRMVADGFTVVGLDNLNAYYDPALKHARLALLGITLPPGQLSCSSATYPNLTFVKMHLEDSEAIAQLFEKEKFDIVIHLAAQAGVRYSLENPRAYISSNIDGFLNILEGCRQNNVNHLVFASSSSVYGLNGKTPFSEHHSTEHPVSLYAATKKSNELMAHAYSVLYGLPVTGLRFFTVYGPWCRPDMSPYLFIDSIVKGIPIKIFNNGEMLRDFTYIDDIVESISRLVCTPPKEDIGWDSISADPAYSRVRYRIYNVGSERPVRLLDYVCLIEGILGIEGIKEFKPLQAGDVVSTYSDSSDLAHQTGYRPTTGLEEGMRRTVEWYKRFHQYGVSGD